MVASQAELPQALPLPAMSEQVREFLFLMGDAVGCYGNANLARVPGLENNLGGAALAIMSILSMDLKSGGKYGIVAAAENYFGSLDDAYANLGLFACVSLGGGTFLRLAQQGELTNLANPLWIKVLANVGPYLVATGIDTPQAGDILKKTIKNKVGDQLIFTVPSQDGDNPAFKVTDSVRVNQQVALFVGASMMMGFAVARNDEWTAGDIRRIHVPQVTSALLNIIASGKPVDAQAFGELFGTQPEADAQPKVLTDEGLNVTLSRRGAFRAMVSGLQEVRQVLAGYSRHPDWLLENIGVMLGAPNKSAAKAAETMASR